MEEGALVDVEIDGDPDLFIAARDFSRIADSQQKVGFIEGAEAGKQQGLQEGFENGFAAGMQSTIHWAVLRGKVNAIQSYCTLKQQRGNTLTAESSRLLDELLKEIRTAEEKCKKEHLKAKESEYTRLITQLEQTASVGQHQPVVGRTITMETLLGCTEVPKDIHVFERRLSEIQSIINTSPDTLS